MKSPRPFQLGLCQMQVLAGQPGRNRNHAVELIEKSHQLGADVALLPECCNLGWTHPSAFEMAEPIPDGDTFRALAEAAKDNDIYVCAGLVERAGTRIFNSAVLIDTHGRLLLLHRKLHELDIGHAFYAQGDQLHVAETDFGTIGVMICADAFAHGQVISRSLGYMGADVILSPCAWAVDANHDNATQPYGSLWKECYGTVAHDFRVWIAGVSNVGPIPEGPWAGRKCIGCSLVVNDRGQPKIMLPYGEYAETVEVVPITPVSRPARGCSWKEVWQ